MAANGTHTNGKTEDGENGPYVSPVSFSFVPSKSKYKLIVSDYLPYKINLLIYMI